MKKASPEEYIGKPLQRVLDAITSGRFGNKEENTELVNTIRNHNDHYLVCQDFNSYCEANEKVY